jgi:hypothetical protein
VLQDELARADEDGGADAGPAGPASIAELARRVDSTPALAAAVRGVGLSSREYAIATLALAHAGGLAAKFVEGQPRGPLPPGVSKHNLDFVLQNRTRLTALGTHGAGAR